MPMVVDLPFQLRHPGGEDLDEVAEAEASRAAQFPERSVLRWCASTPPKPRRWWGRCARLSASAAVLCHPHFLAPLAPPPRFVRNLARLAALAFP